MPDNARTRDPETREGDEAVELRELREAAHLLGARLREFGAARMGEAEMRVGMTADDLLVEGRRMLREIETRMSDTEKRVERSLRAHPGSWIGGLLGVIGFGLVLGLLLHRRE
ncbi:hypothetical protein [Salipiger mangrovisoli]|uniref:Membrane-anchored ribosome-binding protein, inhibits growth in stationary phase, ElaB/YqjD/DUF883 family n=1 Tax=Salipiger mangrovisoli TaxID=2865933 RepID=A0ABR9X5B4_9RHOB|nr:hypothetical protein [Salipiger mangrovisoli]MBE9638785.1 hypothetical protein [Salipiger mangrovisoli]